MIAGAKDKLRGEFKYTAFLSSMTSVILHPAEQLLQVYRPHAVHHHCHVKVSHFSNQNLQREKEVILGFSLTVMHFKPF